MENWPVTLDLVEILSGLLGGLALFLFGMERMAEALKQIAGERIKAILATLTRNRLRGLITGAVVTAAIQSSSVTTVLVVGFVSAGAMSLPQAMGVILGADIGTTITAQLIAFDVTRYALLLVAIGFGLSFFSGRGAPRLYGASLMGTGLIFYGMGLMSQAMSPLRGEESFTQFMAALESPLLAVVCSAAFTALIQASSATIGVAIALASQGLVTIETGVAILLGANIGTCATAGLAAIGRTRNAVRAAIAHVLFKVIGTLLVLPFIPQFAELVGYLSPPVPPGLSELEARAKLVPRQIANAHTLFNVGIAFGFLPFSRLFAEFLARLLPERERELSDLAETEIALDRGLIQVPSLALELVRKASRRMGAALLRMFDEGARAVYGLDSEKMERVRDMDTDVDSLHARLVEYLGHIGRSELSASQSRDVIRAMSAIGNLESIGDVIETNFSHLVETGNRNGIRPREAMVAELERFRAPVREAVEKAVEAFVQNNPALAREVVDQKTLINELDLEFKRIQLARFGGQSDPDPREQTFELGVADAFKRIHYHARRVAKRVVESNSTDGAGIENAKEEDHQDRKLEAQERSQKDQSDPSP